MAFCRSLKRVPLLEFTFALCVVGVAAACGAKPKSVVTEPGTGTATATMERDSSASGLSGGNGCRSKTNCAAAAMEVKGAGFGNAGLTGKVNEAVPWDFAGVDTKDPSRRVAILLNNIPPGASVNPPIDSGEMATTVKIIWTPTSTLKNVGAGLQIFMRDLDRCEMMESDRAVCQEYRKLDAYDEMSEIDWQILSGTEDSDSSVVPPTSPTVPVSNNCTKVNSDTVTKVVDGVKGIKSLSDGDMGGLGGLLGMIGAVGELAGGSGSPSC